MKSLKLASSIIAMAVLAVPAAVRAQDTDKDKLIAIEKAFADNANPGPKSADVAKHYIYDGPVDQLTPTGRVGSLPKARVIELSSKPDPNDPKAMTTQKLSAFRVDVYGATALVSYKQVSTDTGHKLAALNTSIELGCLDTFVKKAGDWYYIGGGCAPAGPVAQSVWDAAKQSIAEEPKDVQQAFH
jgi:hypothetical protein